MYLHFHNTALKFLISYILLYLGERGHVGPFHLDGPACVRSTTNKDEVKLDCILFRASRGYCLLAKETKNTGWSRWRNYYQCCLSQGVYRSTLSADCGSRKPSLRQSEPGSVLLASVSRKKSRLSPTKSSLCTCVLRDGFVFIFLFNFTALLALSVSCVSNPLTSESTN